MTDDNITQSRQAIAAQDRSAPLKVTGKLAKAIEQMVWFGASRADAAETAGLKDHSLRAALKKPHVLRHYHAELGFLRESARAKNFHRLDAIAGGEGGNDMAKVAAIKTMEAISNDPIGAGARNAGGPRAGWAIDLSDTSPGVTIVIRQPDPPAPMRDITPTIDDGDDQIE